jgi:hypothetical protein
MTREEKYLLLIDLCARLPYEVIVDYKENEFENPHWKITTIYPDTFDGRIGYDKRVGAGSESGSRPFKIGEFKPYLRSMSNMTKKEFDEYMRFIKHSWEGINKEEDDYYVKVKDRDIYTDWLLSHHFDYRGLIKKGLAIEAPVDMYKTE